MPKLAYDPRKDFVPVAHVADAPSVLLVTLTLVDKITTVPKSKVGARVGRLYDEDILRFNQAVLVFLGLAISPKVSREG